MGAQVNTGLLDEGLATIIGSLTPDSALRHLYAGSNGCTEKTGLLVARHLSSGNNRVR